MHVSTYNIFINAIILSSNNNFEITIDSTLAFNIFYYIFVYIFRYIYGGSIKVLRHEKIARCFKS